MLNVIRGKQYLENLSWEDQNFAVWKGQYPYKLSDNIKQTINNILNKSVDNPIELSYNNDSAGDFISSWNVNKQLHLMDDFKQLVEWIEEMFPGHYITEMWTNKTEPGGHLRAHNHAGNKYAGTYYLQAPENCGDIIMNGFCKGDIKENDVIIFDGWVSHRTQPNNSTQDRIVIAFTMEETSGS